jgi:two-component sensor histidine kinase
LAKSDLNARLAELRRLLPPIGSWRAYLFALACLGIGALARAPLDDAINQHLPPFLTVYPVVVIASFVGGIRVGVATALAGGFMAWLLWAQPYGWQIPSYAAVTFIIYVLAVGVTITAAGIARHSLDDVTTLEQTRTRQAHESVHRIKNLLTVVQALSYRIAGEEGGMDGFLAAFHQRLRALGEAQNILVRSDMQPTAVQTLVDGAVAPFRNAQLDIQGGPALTLPAALVSGLTLALYELATNATKYGAFSNESGRVVISWRNADGRSSLEWRETGTSVDAGEERLGCSLIRGALTAAEGAGVTYDARPGAITCVFQWPDSDS